MSGALDTEPVVRRAGRRASAPAKLVLALVALLVVVAGVGRLAGWVPSLLHPFGKQTVDRSQPALLKSLTDLRDYHAASGHFEVLVDLQKDTKNLPSALSGERTLFVGVGDVDASIDFSHLDKNAVKVSEDRRTATITLPHAVLSDPRVDPQHSYVAARDRGLLDRLGSVFSGNPTNDQPLYAAAADKMRAAAAADPELTGKAEENTRQMLQGLLSSLGYTNVTVNFTGDQR